MSSLLISIFAPVSKSPVKKIFYIFLAALILSQSSCGMKKTATNIIGKIASDGMAALEGEGDAAFARESAPALIKTLEVLSFGNLKNRISLVLLSQSYGQFAFGFVEEDMLRHRADAALLAKDRARANLFYKRGRDFGMRALDGKMGKKARAPFPEFKKALSRLNKKDVPALFWTAFNWALYLNLNLDDPQVIADFPKIQAMIDRVIKLKSDFYYGSAHAFRGVISATRPKMLGGDTNLAESEFKKAMEIAPAYLMTRVLYAQYYARQMQDEALFQKTLTEVMEAEDSNLPEQNLANALAKQRAALLISMKKNLF